MTFRACLAGNVKSQTLCRPVAAKRTAQGDGRAGPSQRFVSDWLRVQQRRHRFGPDSLRQKPLLQNSLLLQRDARLECAGVLHAVLAEAAFVIQAYIEAAGRQNMHAHLHVGDKPRAQAGKKAA